MSGLDEDVLQRFADLQVDVLGAESEGCLKTLAGDLQTLFGIFGHLVGRHFAVQELDDRKDEASFVGHLGLLFVCIQLKIKKNKLIN